MGKYIKKTKTKNICDIIQKDIYNNKISIGFDVSMHSTGIAILRTTEKYTVIEKLEKIITPKKIDELSALDAFISQLDYFKNKISQEYKINNCIIEDCFMGSNVRTLKCLARHSALVYDRFKSLADNIEFILPTSVRNKINFKKSSKKVKGYTLKKELVQYVNEIFDIDIKNKDNDLTDALILALYGLL